MKPTIKALQNKAALARRHATLQAKEHDRQLTKVLEENERSLKTVSEQAAKIVQRDAEIRLRDSYLAEARAERDRLIRMVDQFTSVSIVAHGATLNPPALENQPNKLRRT